MVGEAALSNKAKGVFIWISLNSSKICFIFLRTVLTSVLGLWNGCFVPLPTPFFNNGVVLMYRKFSDLIVLSWRKSSSFYKNKSRSYCTSRILIFLCLCIWHSSSWERFFISPQQANGITSAPAFWLTFAFMNTTWKDIGLRYSLFPENSLVMYLLRHNFSFCA